MITSVDAREGFAMKRGVKYEVASGHYIPNEGEKKFDAVTDQGTTTSPRTSSLQTQSW